jgi:hypothetical protein
VRNESVDWVALDRLAELNRTPPMPHVWQPMPYVDVRRRPVLAILGSLLAVAMLAGFYVVACGLAVGRVPKRVGA